MHNFNVSSTDLQGEGKIGKQENNLWTKMTKFYIIFHMHNFLLITFD